MIKKINLKKLFLVNIFAIILTALLNSTYFYNDKNTNFYSIDLEAIQNSYLTELITKFENYNSNSLYELSLVFDKYKFFNIDEFTESFNANVSKELKNSSSIQIKGNSIVFFEINNYKNFKKELNRYLIKLLEKFHENKIKKVIREKIYINDLYLKYLKNGILGQYNNNFQTNHELFYEQIIFNEAKLDLNNLYKQFLQLEINYNDLNYEKLITQTKNLSLTYRLIYFIFSFFIISIMASVLFFNSIFRNNDN